MNQHLQLFRFFHESEEPLHIENNLTRAFALCLKYDPTLLFAMLKQWLKPEDFDYLLSNPPEDSEFEINLQVETGELVENARRLYAIGITEHDTEKDWSDIAAGVERIDKQNITDLVIAVKDITIVIEVKRTMEDCKQQLCQQIMPFMKAKNPPALTAFHYSWQRVIEQVRKLHHFNLLTKKENPFTPSLLQLIQTRFNRWIPTTPFAHLAFDAKHTERIHHLELNKRLMKAMHSLGKEDLAFFPDRVAIKINRQWASEAIPEFRITKDKPCLQYYVWPGNIKQQGHSLYSLPSEWTKVRELHVGDEIFAVEICRHIKFMHFNKYVTNIDIGISDEVSLKKEINTRENFYKYSGKWNRDQWGELDSFLQEHCNFNWKDRCNWDKHFENSDRSYLTLSLGYTISVMIPYNYLQSIDRQSDDYLKVGHLLKETLTAIVNMVEVVKPSLPVA